MLGVTRDSQFNSWGKTPVFAGTAEEIARGLDAAVWQRLSAGNGTKGLRLYDRAWCELADIDAAECDKTETSLSTRGLLIHRNIADGAPAYFSTWCPTGTDIARLVEVEGYRWAIEDSFETANSDSVSITTRVDHGLDGIATFRRACWPLP